MSFFKVNKKLSKFYYNSGYQFKCEKVKTLLLWVNIWPGSATSHGPNFSIKFWVLLGDPASLLVIAEVVEDLIKQKTVTILW